jgi:hypothetical protein
MDARCRDAMTMLESNFAGLSQGHATHSAPAQALRNSAWPPSPTIRPSEICHLGRAGGIKERHRTGVTLHISSAVTEPSFAPSRPQSGCSLGHPVEAAHYMPEQ